jgi:hypothetical protein
MILCERSAAPHLLCQRLHALQKKGLLLHVMLARPELLINSAWRKYQEVSTLCMHNPFLTLVTICLLAKEYVLNYQAE